MKKTGERPKLIEREKREKFNYHENIIRDNYVNLFIVARKSSVVVLLLVALLPFVLAVINFHQGKKGKQKMKKKK